MTFRWLTNMGKDLESKWNLGDFDYKWLSDKIIRDPKATDFYTVEQLKKMGMVGIYAKEEA